MRKQGAVSDRTMQAKLAFLVVENDEQLALSCPVAASAPPGQNDSVSAIILAEQRSGSIFLTGR